MTELDQPGTSPILSNLLGRNRSAVAANPHRLRPSWIPAARTRAFPRPPALPDCLRLGLVVNRPDRAPAPWVRQIKRGHFRSSRFPLSLDLARHHGFQGERSFVLGSWTWLLDIYTPETKKIQPKPSPLTTCHSSSESTNLSLSAAAESASLA